MRSDFVFNKYIPWKENFAKEDTFLAKVDKLDNQDTHKMSTLTKTFFFNEFMNLEISNFSFRIDNNPTYFRKLKKKWIFENFLELHVHISQNHFNFLVYFL